MAGDVSRSPAAPRLQMLRNRQELRSQALAASNSPPPPPLNKTFTYLAKQRAPDKSLSLSLMSEKIVG